MVLDRQVRQQNRIDRAGTDPSIYGYLIDDKAVPQSSRERMNFSINDAKKVDFPYGKLNGISASHDTQKLIPGSLQT